MWLVASWFPDGMELGLSAVKVESHNHWTPREFLNCTLKMLRYKDTNSKCIIIKLTQYY